MKNTLEIFADFSCPWSYFMTPNIEKVKAKYDIEIKWRVYLLRPDLNEEGEELNDAELIAQDNEVFALTAKLQNLPLSGKRAQRFNTQPSHLISKWADENNVGDIFRKTVYYYYFVLKKNIALSDVLKEIIYTTGLYEIKPAHIFENKKYAKLVKEDLVIAKKLKISSTPAVKFKGKVFSGFLKYAELEKIIDD
ncbi:MAG: DsbA family protein [Ignavibacteria bacterium]